MGYDPDNIDPYCILGDNDNDNQSEITLTFAYCCCLCICIVPIRVSTPFPPTNPPLLNVQTIHLHLF